ncbi:hypothetical protein N7449_007563 [Penicillium cf. viridicatum]|uniref:Uncharacterized protein n=1 Tax=Penicillium cf. viridicatum TaxID=2972119 RepID=A0A9W9JHL0_9EURO|nr:hypothetical protein N7449_007563 [Penicillium cf. viridicatum]
MRLTRLDQITLRTGVAIEFMFNRTYHALPIAPQPQIEQLIITSIDEVLLYNTYKEQKKEVEADPSRPDNLANWSRCIIPQIGDIFAVLCVYEYILILLDLYMYGAVQRW